MDDVTKTLAISPDDGEIRAGTVIDDYTVIKLLGEGGMGEVYLVENSNPKRREALKILSKKWSSNEDLKKRFQEEAQRLSDVDHENIVFLYTKGSYMGRPYFTMQYIGGQSLSQLIKKGAIPPKDAIEIGIGLCEGLRVAHSLRVIHRDIKPANVLIGTNKKPVLLDFGIAKRGTGSELTEIGSTVGSVSYMSPEQARGDDLDTTSDIFSFGILLYETLTCKRPFEGDRQMAIIRSIESDDPKPLKEHMKNVPQGLQKIIDKLLSKEVSKRYQDMSDVVLDLRLVLETLGSTSASPAGHKLNPVVIYSAIGIFLAAIIWLVLKQGTDVTPISNPAAASDVVYKELTLAKARVETDSVPKYAPERMTSAREFENQGNSLYQSRQYDSSITLYRLAIEELRVGSENAKPLWGTVDKTPAPIEQIATGATGSDGADGATVADGSTGVNGGAGGDVKWRERAKFAKESATTKRALVSKKGFSGIAEYTQAEAIYNSAVEAYVDGGFQQATVGYDSSTAIFDLVLRKIGNRDNAKGSKRLAVASKQQALDVRVNVENKNNYDKAVRDLSKGDGYMSSTDFFRADKSYKSANKLFKSARTVTLNQASSYQSSISDLYDSMEVAKQKLLNLGKSVSSLSVARNPLDSAVPMIKDYYLADGKQLIDRAYISFNTTSIAMGITDSAMVVSTVMKYLEAHYVSGDLNLLRKLIPSRSKEELDNQKVFTDNAKNISVSETFASFTVSKNSASISASVKVNYKLSGDKEENFDLKFELERSDSDWIIKSIK